MANEDLLRHHIAETERRFDRIESKVDRLLEFKWQIIGGSLVISAVLSIGIAILFGGK